MDIDTDDIKRKYWILLIDYMQWMSRTTKKFWDSSNSTSPTMAISIQLFLTHSYRDIAKALQE